MAYDITNSFLEEFDYLFHPFLKQQGSALMMAVSKEPVMGGVKYIRQSSVGDAHFITSSGGQTQFTQIKNDKRRLEPKAFTCPILLDDVDLVMQGTPDVAMLAADAANSCGKIIDEIIIKGIGGPAYSAGGGSGADKLKTLSGADKVTAGPIVASYDKTQTIAWNDATLQGGTDTPIATAAGLSSSKLAKAVEKLVSAHNWGPLVCVCSPYAAMTLRADPRVANTNFNTQPSLATGLNTPYGGVSAFIECTKMDSGKSKAQADGTYHATDGKNVEYAYVYAINQIKLGVSKELELKQGTVAERYFNQGLMYWGMYDCARMFEEAVVRIEINRDLADVTADSFAK